MNPTPPCCGTSAKTDTGIDTTTGAIYCEPCEDVEVSDTFDELYHATTIEAEETSDKSRDLKGRARGRWKPWKAVEGEGEKLAEHFTKTSCLGMSNSTASHSVRYSRCLWVGEYP